MTFLRCPRSRSCSRSQRFLHSLESCKAYNRIEVSAGGTSGWWLIQTLQLPLNVSRAHCRIRFGPTAQAASENDLERHDTSQPRRTHHQPKARPTLPQLPHLVSTYSLCMLPSAASQHFCPMLRLPGVSTALPPSLVWQKSNSPLTQQSRSAPAAPTTTAEGPLSANQLVAPLAQTSTAQCLATLA